jgi:hypothetical protein
MRATVTTEVVLGFSCTSIGVSQSHVIFLGLLETSATHAPLTSVENLHVSAIVETETGTDGGENG